MDIIGIGFGSGFPGPHWPHFRLHGPPGPAEAQMAVGMQATGIRKPEDGADFAATLEKAMAGQDDSQHSQTSPTPVSGVSPSGDDEKKRRVPFNLRVNRRCQSWPDRQ